MRRQLVLMAIATTSIVVLAFVIPLAILVRNVAEDRAVNSATTTAQGLYLLASLTPSEASIALVPTAKVNEGLISLYRADGTIIGDKSRPASKDALELARQGRSLAREAPGGIDVLTPIAYLDNAVDATTVVRVFVPDRVRRRGVVRAWIILGSLGLLLILVSAAVGDRIARSIMKPLRGAADVAERLASGDLSARTGLAGTVEVAAVSTALNILAERIAELLQEERETIADLSHRLRTPLTALRLSAEQLPESEQRDQIAADLERLEDTLTTVIRQARAPVRTDLGGDLVVAVRDRMAFWSLLGAAQGRSISIDLRDEAAPVSCSRHELDSVIDAIVGNVFQHTPTTGACRVTVESGDDIACVYVDDNGPGMPNLDVTARGRRGPRSKGTGLGLDIARQVAERCGGRLEISRSPMGGSRVFLSLGTRTSKVS